MFFYGRTTWLRKGEAFSIAFSMLARFAPFEVRVTDKTRLNDENIGLVERENGVNCYECFRLVSPEYRELNIRPFGAGLLVGNRVSFSMMVFVILMLSTVTFDGFMGTSLWVYDIQGAIPDWRPIQPFLFEMEMSGISRETIISTVGLYAFPLLFFGLYLFFILLMKLLVPFRSGMRNWSLLEIKKRIILTRKLTKLLKN